MNKKDSYLQDIIDLVDQSRNSNDPQQGEDSLHQAYSKIVHLLETKQDKQIQDLMDVAFESKDQYLYDKMNCLLLTGIHCHTYYIGEKQKNSSLFIVPYFTSPMNQIVDTISYPPVSQIESVFKKHFYENGLINDTNQLHIPTIKINESLADNMQYSDWYELHKNSIQKINPKDKSKDQYYKYGFAFPIPKDGELNYFPILVTYGETSKPPICETNNIELDYEAALQKIETDLSMISANAFCAIGVPSEFQMAIEFGKEIQQDFLLNSFLKRYIEKHNTELVVLPLYEGQLALFSWNNDRNKVDLAIEIFPYSSEDQEVADYLLQQINFHDIKKTYLFETPTLINNIKEIYDLNQETFHSLFENNEVVVLEKNSNNKPTLH